MLIFQISVIYVLGCGGKTVFHVLDSALRISAKPLGNIYLQARAKKPKLTNCWLFLGQHPNG